MKNSVLSSGADSDGNKAVGRRVFARLWPSRHRPARRSRPISRRVTKHRMNVWMADTPSSVEVIIDAPLIASMKLTNAENAAQAACSPAVPMTIAPMAIGTVRNDMYSGPTGTLPKPMSFITTSIATRMASCVSVCTLIFC